MSDVEDSNREKAYQLVTRYFREQGQLPTQAWLQKEIGGGHHYTYRDAIKEFLADLRQQLTDYESLPQFPPALAAQFGQAWTELVRAADKRATETIRAVEEKTSLRVKEAHAEADRIRADHDALKRELDDVQKNANRLNDKVTSLTNSLDVETVRANDAEKRAVEWHDSFVKKSEEYDRNLKIANDCAKEQESRLNTLLDKEHGETGKYKSRVQALEQELTTMRNSHATKVLELTQAGLRDRQQAESANNEKELLGAQLRSITDESKSLKIQLMDALQERAGLIKERELLAHELGLARTRYDALIAQLQPKPGAIKQEDKP